MKSYSKKEQRKWRKEIVKDIDTGKRYLNYYNSSSILMKSEEYKSPLNLIVKLVRKLIFTILKMVIWLSISLLAINYIVRYLYESGVSSL